MRVNHNIPALNAWRQGTIIQRQMSKTLERLSSGLRINRAADDAAGLAISEKMRAQIRGLDQATRNAQDGISLIQTAEGALNETHSILQRMRELSVQAANDTYTSEDRQEIQKEVDQLTAEIDRIAATTEFNNKKLLDGSTSALVSSDKLTTEIFMRGGLRVLDQFGQKARGGGNFKLDIEAAAGKNEIQKSDIFKVKHNQSGAKTINADSNITDFDMTGAPSGDYEVTTGFVQANPFISANLSRTLLTNSAGETASFGFDNQSDYAGSWGNGMSISFQDTGTAALSVTMNTASRTVTFGINDGVSTLGDIFNAALANGNFSPFSMPSGVNVVNISSLTTTDFAGGVDSYKAEMNISGQFQQIKDNGHGLVDSVVVSGTQTEQFGVNASMYFEVTGKDDVNNTVTVSASSQQYSRKAILTEVSRSNIVLNTTAANTVTVGDVTMTLDLADQDHFTVGDKFGLELEAAGNNAMAQVNISDDNGNSKEWTFVSIDNTLASNTTSFNSYYLDSETGNVDLGKSSITFNSNGPGGSPTVENETHYNGSLYEDTFSGSSLGSNASYTFTEMASAAATSNAVGTLKSSYTASGEDLLSLSAATDLTANMSASLEVIGKDGNNVDVRVKAHIIDEAGTSSYFEGVVTYDTTSSTANQ